MLKKYFLILLISLLSKNVTGQRVINQFRFAPGQHPRKIECHSLGDNLLLGYQQWIDGYGKFHCYLVTPKGVLKQIDFEKDEFYSIIETVQVNPEVWRLYFTSENGKKLFLKSVDINLSTGEKIYSQNLFEVKNQLLGSRIEDKNLLLYSIDPANGSNLILSKIENLDHVEETQYQLPIDLSSYKQSDIAFILPTNFVSIAQSLQMVKIFPSNESVDIIIDDSKKDKKDKTSGTLLVHTDLTTKASQTTFIEEPSDVINSNFRVRYKSYFFDGYLFRVVVQSKLLTLKIFDGKNGDLIHTKLFPKDKESKVKPAIFRDSKTLEVRKKTLAHVIGSPDMWYPFIIVNKDSSSNKISIVCGNHRNRNGVGPWGINPVAMVLTAAKLLSDAGLSHYFYYNGNLKEGFEYYSEDPFNGVRQKIDSFEMTKTKKGNPMYENLLFTFYKKGVLGIYDDVAERKMKLVEF